MTLNLGRVAKALVAGGGALSASLAQGAADGNLTRADWIVALVAGAAIGWATWRVPNRPTPPAPPSDGHGVEDHPAAPEASGI